MPSGIRHDDLVSAAEINRSYPSRLEKVQV